MTARLERILTKLVQRHAAYLLQKTEGSAQRMQELAAGLARVGVLVMLAEVPQAFQLQKDELINQWVSWYGSLYLLLTERLFPSFTRLDAVYADDQQPTIIVMTGESTVVIDTIARFVVPYIAARQGDTMVSEAELNGVMTFVLDALEATDLPPHEYHNLNKGGMKLLQSLLSSPLRQATLTDFKRPMFKELKSQLPDPPQKTPTPTKPADIPEPPITEETPTRQMFVSSIPIFYGPNRKPTKRRPPIPDLPDHLKGESDQ